MWTIEISFCGMHVTDEQHDNLVDVIYSTGLLLTYGFTAPLGNHFEADDLELKVYRSVK